MQHYNNSLSSYVKTYKALYFYIIIIIIIYLFYFS